MTGDTAGRRPPTSTRGRSQPPALALGPLLFAGPVPLLPPNVRGGGIADAEAEAGGAQLLGENAPAEPVGRLGIDGRGPQGGGQALLLGSGAATAGASEDRSRLGGEGLDLPVLGSGRLPQPGGVAALEGGRLGPAEPSPGFQEGLDVV